MLFYLLWLAIFALLVVALMTVRRGFKQRLRSLTVVGTLLALLLTYWCCAGWFLCGAQLRGAQPSIDWCDPKFSMWMPFFPFLG